MKNIVVIIGLMIVFTNCKAQQTVNLDTFHQGESTGKYFKDINNKFTPFLGTWENTTGNITFRVTLYKSEMEPMGYPVRFYMDLIEGRYSIIRNAGSANEKILHNSVKYYPQSDTTLNNSISGRTIDGIYFGAYVDDNSVDENTIGILRGKLSMTITDPNSTPLQAHWKITKRINIQGFDFNIPTDIILTKVL